MTALTEKYMKIIEKLEDDIENSRKMNENQTQENEAHILKLKKEIDFKEKEIHNSVVKIQAMKCEVKAQCTEITKLKKEIKCSVTIENTNDAAIAANEIIENLLTSVMREKDEDYYHYSINQELLSQRDSLLQEVNQQRTELEKKEKNH